MTVFKAQVANFVTYGEEITRKANGGWTRNKIRLTLGGKRVLIRQRAAMLRQNQSKLKGKLVESSIVSVHGIKTMEEGQEFVTDLCWLLSFATQSRVMSYEYAFGKRKKWHGLSGVYGDWRSPFGAGIGKVSDFVTQAWPQFQKLKEPRALGGLIHMISVCDAPGMLMEMKVTTAVQCLESIKSYFALVEGHRFGISESASGAFVTIKQRKEKPVSFEKLMELTLKDVNMPVPASFARIKKLRNAIIHRGFIRETDAVTKFIFGPLNAGAMHTAMFASYEDIQDLLREFVLRLLGYKGQYLPYKDASLDQKTIK